MAVTAYPTVKIDSVSGGSDSAASGAGPATALTGTAASTDAGGTVVTLDGSPDLSGVATDGSHLIWINDTTAGRRNWSQINAKDDVGKTVTVEQAFYGSLSGKTWAIGGKRATIAGSLRLLNNNSAAGDIGSGSTVELQSGFTETFAAALVVRSTGGANGPLTICGAAGGTRPVLTFSNNGIGVQFRTGKQRLQFLSIVNTNATKTASIAIDTSTDGISVNIMDVKIADATNLFWKGMRLSPTNVVRDCEIGNCASMGILIDDHATVENCWIYTCPQGIVVSSTTSGSTQVIGNLIYNCSTDGINVTAAGTSARAYAPRIRNNTIDACADAIEIQGASTAVAGYYGLSIVNNILSNATGYAINLSGSGVTAAFLESMSARIAGNNVYNAATKYVPSDLVVANETTANPQFSAIASGNAMIGTALKATGVPVGGSLYVGTGSATYSYIDPGCAQRKEVRVPVFGRFSR